MMKLKKKYKIKKEKKMNMDESFKTGLISQICNSLNHRLNLNQEDQFNVEG